MAAASLRYESPGDGIHSFVRTVEPRTGKPGRMSLSGSASRSSSIVRASPLPSLVQNGRIVLP